MSPARASQADVVARFRARLLLAMLTVVSAAMGLALFFAQRGSAANAQRELERAFAGELAALHTIQDVRHAALASRCRVLARRPRIHAALEDNALDLLYPSARDELAGVMERPGDPGEYALSARFYRFLDAKGAVIPPGANDGAGDLSAEEEAALALPRLPAVFETGYLPRRGPDGSVRFDEVMAMPIYSTETGEGIAALVLGFEPFDAGARRPDLDLRAGIWSQQFLHLPRVSPAGRRAVAEKLAAHPGRGGSAVESASLEIDGTPSVLFYQRLNPDSLFPAAYEVMVFPLTEFLASQRRLLWQFAGLWAALFVVAFLASRTLAVRLSNPVERLAEDSEHNRTERQRAEAALEQTHEELQRSARFSADASHQLKTPVTVLRVGLEELLADEKLSGEVREEVSALVHQTFRLTSIIEDLLLLARMDAGRLQLEFARIDLAALIEAALDDLSALPNGQDFRLETDFPEMLPVLAERRYVTLILQNLLENARKYNRPGGRILLTARTEDPWAVVTVGNTGATIPPGTQEHIFERFHRGTAGENVPGYGLGLNLARQLARLHRGDLRLVRSADDWTEFELRLRFAPDVAPAAPNAI